MCYAGTANYICHTVSALSASSRNIAGDVSAFIVAPNFLHRMNNVELQLSDLEAARVIVLSHYHLGPWTLRIFSPLHLNRSRPSLLTICIAHHNRHFTGTSQQRLGNSDGSKDCKFVCISACSF